jgi:hypothetical protein
VEYRWVDLLVSFLQRARKTILVEELSVLVEEEVWVGWAAALAAAAALVAGV